MFLEEEFVTDNLFSPSKFDGECNSRKLHLNREIVSIVARVLLRPVLTSAVYADGFVKLVHLSNEFFVVTSLNLWNWLSRRSLRSPVCVVVGRENNILSCSSTTRCSAAELAENLFSGGGIKLLRWSVCSLSTTTLFHKTLRRKLWIYFPPCWRMSAECIKTNHLT